MNKNRFLLLYLLILPLIACNPACSADFSDKEPNFYYTCFVRKNLSEEADQLNIFLAKYFEAMENHDISSLKELYSDRYIGHDRFDKTKAIALLEESWNFSDNLEYSSEIQNIRFDKTFAAVELSENLAGVTSQRSEITNDNGIIESSSRVVLYLQKYGKGWKIISDKTLYEETSIRYGSAKGLEISLYAPEQVFKGRDYSISLETEIPENTFALGSITNEPLTHPRTRADEIFRQVPSDLNLLERVVQSNTDARNELAVASVSFCTVKKSVFTVPEIDVAGTAVLLKRVNVR